MGHLVDILDPVVDVIDLPAPVELLPDGGGDELGAERGHDRVDGQTVPRGRFDQADIAEPGQGHIEGAGNRGGREGQDVDRSPEALDLLLVAHAEPLLFVDDEQSEVLEKNVLGQYPVRPDQDVDKAFLEVGENGLRLASRLKAGQGLDADREKGHPGPECVQVLAGQDRRGAQDGHLLAVHDGFERGPHGHFRLAVSDVAAEKAVHGGTGFHVRFDVADGLDLVLGLLVFEDLFELRLPFSFGAEGKPLDGFALGIELQEFLGDGLGRLLRPGLGFLPGVRPQLVEGRKLRTGLRESSGRGSGSRRGRGACRRPGTGSL